MFDAMKKVNGKFGESVEKSVNKRIAWSDVLMLAMLVIVKYRMQHEMCNQI